MSAHVARDLSRAPGRSQRAFGPALALTFDNLGVDPDEPAVRAALPGLLDRLDALGLRATFCVEAVNCELHPDAIRELAARGHEVAHHGWRHEPWAGLAPARERELLARGLEAFAGLGIELVGFRPPGGELAPSSERALAELGFRWCSPAGGEPELRAGVVHLPFRWPLVDAWHLLPSVRARAGGPEGAGLETLTATFAAELDGLAAGGGVRVVIFHPFLLLRPESRAAVDALLERIAALPRDGVHVGPAGELAERLRS